LFNSIFLQILPSIFNANFTFPIGLIIKDIVMAIVKDIINSFDSSDELAQIQKEAIETLAALGASKVETFKLEMQESLTSAGEGNNLTVPVSVILQSRSRVRAFSSTESDNIGNVVKNALGAFINGSTESVIDGVGNLITDTLNIFLGKASASEGYEEEYYVATEGLSIVRVDMKAWYRNVSASSIKTKMDRIVCVAYTKSVVDLAKIDFSTFIYLYQQQLLATGMNKEELADAVNSAKEIYDDFQKINGDTSTKQKSISQPPSHQALKRKVPEMA
jgi:hypothetical protein